jgi:beta-barrel assembly-enhancing protease
MSFTSEENITREGITRRQFLWLTAISGAGLVCGCTTNPVTGKSQLMLVSEDYEIAIDKKHSPHQFSADYGPVQDKALNNYLNQTGKRLASKTHRPHMPYSFRAVNATYINAYTFPGGSVAVTRGILLNLNDEAELAGLLGHELGHVNARHTAEQMSKSMLTTAIVGGLATYAGTKAAIYGEVASKLGMLGVGALLASYSRDNEREADALGMEYMVRGKYSPNGLVDLMDMLKSMARQKPSTIELMFATHPMSEERYSTAVQRSKSSYGSAQNLPLHRDRYMDHTAGLRAMKAPIEEMHNGEMDMAKGRYKDAEVHFQKALQGAPGDYAGLLMMAKCQLVQKKHAEAVRYAESAQKTYPREGQAYHVTGVARIGAKDYDAAYEAFSTYEKILPGNPNTIFFKGLSLEGMKQIKKAADHYDQYLQLVQQGEQAEYAYKRLVEWGYIKPRK